MSLTLSIFNFPTTSGDWKHFVYTKNTTKNTTKNNTKFVIIFMES